MRRRGKLIKIVASLRTFSAINYSILSTFSGLFVLPEIKINEKCGTKISNFAFPSNVYQAYVCRFDRNVFNLTWKKERKKKNQLKL